jgi:hypothetical protein
MSAIAGMLACGTFRVDTRSLFSQLTYTNSSSSTPDPDWELQILANLELEAITAYRDPVKMASCLRMLDPDLIEVLGEHLVSAGHSWPKEAKKVPVLGDCGAADDPALVQYVIARLATSAAEMAHSVSMDETNRKKWVYGKVPTALSAIATILENTPPRSTVSEDAPALALSGGSSNGAFSAGFMFELLSLRERALPAEGDGGNYRFSAIVGTSVGSLISQILDLYFVDAAKPVSPAKKALLDQCNGYWTNKPHPSCAAPVDTALASGATCFDGWPTAPGGDVDTGLSGLDATTRADLAARRPRQMCTLTKLYQYFTDDDEQTLLCVEPGPITSAVGVLGRKTQNLVRFDPMFQNIIGPVLDDYSDEMITNDATRVVVSTETEQNQIIGLDERACARLPPGPSVNGAPEIVGGREYCLASGVMASVVLPFFARPVRHAYGGVDPRGQCGTWFDGGLRSGFPTYRALRMTRPAMKPFVADPHVRLRVLAISTARVEGEPATRPQTIVDVAFNAIGQMSSQNQVDEVNLSQQMAVIREDQLSLIMSATGTEREPVEPRVEEFGDETSVSTVFVPDDAPDQIIAGGEYSFDRYIMRGLWIWGRYAATERILGKLPPAGRKALFERLGWKSLEERAKKFAAQDEATMKPWLDAYRKQECPAHAQARMTAGQQRIMNCVASCADVVPGGKDFPQYLMCPNGTRGQ